MTQSTKSSRNWAVRFWKLWLGLALVVLAILFLPTFLGSRWIYQPLLNRIQAGNYRLQVDQVRFRWLSPLSFKGIAIKPQDGPAVFTVREVRTDRSLLGFITGGRRLGRLDIFEPTIDVELLSDGTNLDKLIKALEGDKSATKGSAPAIDIDIHVHGFSSIVHHANEPNPLLIVPPFNVQLAYRAVDGESTLKVEPTQILDQVKVTPELVQLGLGQAVPLLAKSAWFDGKVSLKTEAISIPLDRPIDSTGRAVLTMHELRSGPSDPAIVRLLDIIAQLRKKEPSHELVFMDGSQIDLQVLNGQVQHEGLKMGLPRVDPRLQLTSQGKVGLADSSLDQLIEFPVPLEQLALRESVRDIGVPMIRLPIRGTVDNPEIQWNALRANSADLIGMIRDRVEEESPGTGALLGTMEGLAGGQADEAISAASDLIKELRKRRTDNRSRDSGQVTETNDDPATTRPFRDRLKRILGGDGNKK